MTALTTVSTLSHLMRRGRRGAGLSMAGNYSMKGGRSKAV
jgi:hypothetical protein